MKTIMRCTIDFVVSYGDVFYNYGEDGLDSYEDKQTFELGEASGRTMGEALRDALSAAQLPEGADLPERTLEALRGEGWKWDGHLFALIKVLEGEGRGHHTRLEISFREEYPNSDEWLMEPEEEAVKAMIPKLAAS